MVQSQPFVALHDVDDAIRTLLATAAQSGERVITDGYVQLTRDIVRRARWERSWRIVDNTGPLHPGDVDDGPVQQRVQRWWPHGN